MDKDIKIEKLEHDLMKSVLNGSLTVKEFNKISEKINSRCNYIVRKLITKLGGIVDWWDFDNESGREDGPQGYFDPEIHFESVGYIGKFRYNKYPPPIFKFLHNKGYWLEHSFPTKWIWTDFEDELDKLINEYPQWESEKIQKKLINKEKRIQQKQQKEKLIESALSKLTKEEIKALGY